MADERRAPLAAMRAAFAERYLREISFAADRTLLVSLEREVEPVLAALRESGIASSPGPRGSSSDDSWPELHDVYALLTLLAREAAEHGGTPASALALVPALEAGAAAIDVLVPSAAARSLRVVAIEGYCAAREDRALRELRRSAAAAQGLYELAPRAFLIALGGRHLASDLAPALEEIARELHRRDASSAIVDVARLVPEPDDDVARAIGELCGDARLLGAAIFVVGAGAGLHRRFVEWSIAPSSAQFLDDFPRAVALALARAGHELRPLRRWRSMLRLRAPRSNGDK